MMRQMVLALIALTSINYKQLKNIEMEREENRYLNDVSYEIYRRGYNPDKMDYDKAQESYRDGIEAQEYANREIRQQKDEQQHREMLRHREEEHQYQEEQAYLQHQAEMEAHQAQCEAEQEAQARAEFEAQNEQQNF